MQNFAANILDAEPLVAPVDDGIHGVRLANAIHLSGWVGEEVSITDFDEQRYLSELNKRIADELGLSVRTVESHRLNLKRKLGIEGQAELVKYAVELGKGR